MKKIEKVFSQLSQLYEFNRKLKTYWLKKENKKDQQIVRPDSKKRSRFG
jgi:hypothetical protein